MDLRERMKKYEETSKSTLLDNLPIIIRVDMKNGRGVTSRLYEPFDNVFLKAMEFTMLNVANNMQCCKLAYTQSDEISFIIYKGNSEENYDTQVFYDAKVQKMCSLAASLSTFYFNKYINKLAEELNECDIGKSPEKIFKGWGIDTNKVLESYGHYIDLTFDNLIIFDARCFNLSLDEVSNYLIWRQQDATRNSIYALARSLYSHNELQGLNGKQLQDKMFTEKGINWNDLTTPEKRGIICYRGKTVEDRGWNLDLNIPVFTQNKNYIDKYL